MIFTMALELFWMYDIFEYIQNSSKAIVNIIQSEQF
jgi:hypothetical protein